MWMNDNEYTLITHTVYEWRKMGGTSRDFKLASDRIYSRLCNEEDTNAV